MQDSPVGGALKCPKCSTVMRSYERNGVVVEQCEGCRGVFLDRGELEHLLDFEQRMSEPARTETAVGSHRDDDHRRADHRSDRDRDDDDYRRKDKRHRRKGLLSEIFDFD